MAKVAACLQLGVYINTRSGDGLWSGLTVAAAHNCVEVVELLLQQPGLDLNMKTVTFAGIGPYSAADKRRLMPQFRSEWTALMFRVSRRPHRNCAFSCSAPEHGPQLQVMLIILIF